MKKVLLWTVAIVITLLAVFYQRLTGPTHPKRVKVEIKNKEYKLKLLRSHGGDSNARIKLSIKEDVNAILYYKYYPETENEEWKPVVFVRSEENLVAELPNQPPAGKLKYFISLNAENGTVDIGKEEPIIIRFKGDVPVIVLIPHVIFMFIAMFLANAAGLFAFANIEAYKLYTKLTLVLIGIGGMILGPVVQKYAFGEFWTGVPFGWDLTDNKTLISFLFWIVAVIGNWKKDRRYLTVIAAIVGLIIYSIPHSMFGSELDRASGNITQGIVQFFYLW